MAKNIRTAKNAIAADVDSELTELLGEEGAQVWAANPGELTEAADAHLTEVLEEDDVDAKLQAVYATFQGAGDELTDPQEEVEAILEETELADLPVATVIEVPAEVVDAEVVSEPATRYEVVASNCYEQLISLVGKDEDPETPLVAEGDEELAAALALKTGWFTNAAGAPERHRIVGFTVRGDGDTLVYRRTKEGVERLQLEDAAA